MIEQVIPLLYGEVRVQLRGLRQQYFLNVCTRNRIIIKNLIPIEDGYEFTIAAADYKQIKRYIKKAKVHTKIVDKKGVPFFFFQNRNRKIGLVAAILCVLTLYHSTNYIWQIQITGNERVETKQLMDYLKDHGVHQGIHQKKCDFTAIEDGLREQFEPIAWSSVSLDGTRLVLEIKEKLPMKSSLKPDKKGHWNLVASEDCTIASIVTRSGTPLVKSGDIVSKGAVLVSGTLTILADDGTVAKTHDVVADADIIGYVEYPSSFLEKFIEKGIPIIAKNDKIIMIEQSVAKYEKVSLNEWD